MGSDSTNRFTRGVGRLVGAAAVSAALATACVTPPGPGGGNGGAIAECPARTTTALERARDNLVHEPRAFSPDGEWLLSSWVTDDDALDLQLQPMSGGGAPVAVARLVPHAWPWETLHPGGLIHAVDIAVTDGGDVVFAGRPEGSAFGMWRWDRTTAQLTALPSLELDPLAGHTAQVLAPLKLSADGARTAWQEGSVDPAGAPAFRTVVVDTATGQVLGTFEGRMAHISKDLGVGVQRLDHPEWHQVDLVVDLSTGATDLLEDARQALIADGVEYPDHRWTTQAQISDGGRYVAFEANGSTRGQGDPGYGSPLARIYVWDRVDGTLSRAPISQSELSLPNLDAVAEDGRALFSRLHLALPSEQRINEWDPATGAVRVIDREWMAQTNERRFARIGSRAPAATSDLQNVAVTFTPLISAPTAELRVSRCR